jgi:hypothetical protein
MYSPINPKFHRHRWCADLGPLQFQISRLSHRVADDDPMEDSGAGEVKALRPQWRPSLAIVTGDRPKRLAIIVDRFGVGPALPRYCLGPDKRFVPTDAG